MIYRTWICLNRYCLHENTVADVEYPPCPRCGGAKVKWIPKAVNIKSERTQNIDADVKQLRDVYGDKNYQSPRRGERMAPKLNPSVNPARTMPFTAPGHPGWAANLPVDPQTGAPLPYCTTTNVTAPLKAEVGRGHAGDPKLGLNRLTDVQAKHGTQADIRR
jgi:hypothetical protein